MYKQERARETEMQDGRNATGGTSAHRGGLWEMIWKAMTPAERRAAVSSARPVGRDMKPLAAEQLRAGVRRR
jgi:hypothetical protein